MTPSDDTQSQRDQALARRFQALRDAERASAPPLPALPAQTPPRDHRPALGALALLASAAAVLLVLVIQPESQSPDALYREVMQSAALITDEFLQTPAGTQPEVRELPVFEPGRHHGGLEGFN
ncbi:MAG: hypothetical protein R3E54_10200 [Halioglobus sp.]